MEGRRKRRDGGQRKGRLNDSLPSSNFVKLETPYEVLLQRERWGGRKVADLTYKLVDRQTNRVRGGERRTYIRIKTLI